MPKNSAMPQIPIVIVGGGIGGLAAAAALHKVGVHAVVLEQAPEIHEVGAGLSLWSNAMKALRQLGLEEPLLLRLGSTIDRMSTVTSQGRILNVTDIQHCSRQAGAPSICISRADLQRSLAQLLTPAHVRTGARCVGFTQDQKTVRIHLDDGVCVEGSALVGADGIDSIMRSQLVGKSDPRYAGYTCWRAMIHTNRAEALSGQAMLALGPGTQIGLFKCGPGRINWFATKNCAAGAPDPPDGRKAEVLRLCQNWVDPIPAIIRDTPAAAIIRNDIYDRPPLRRWGNGLATLLGDAAHPTTPNLGQGACQAIEDAVTLAHCLPRAPSLAAGLRWYEDLRRKRTAGVIRDSWMLGRCFQVQNSAAVWLRNHLSRNDFIQTQGVRAFAELLCFDVPALIQS